GIFCLHRLCALPLPPVLLARRDRHILDPVVDCAAWQAQPFGNLVERQVLFGAQLQRLFAQMIVAPRHQPCSSSPLNNFSHASISASDTCTSLASPSSGLRPPFGLCTVGAR